MKDTSNPPPPLLRLPGELRNKIYTYVFDTPELWTITFRPTTVTCVPEPAFTQRFPTFLALTRICRQIRAETRLMPWKRCVWKLSDDSAFISLEFCRWWAKADNAIRRVDYERMGVREQLLCVADVWGIEGFRPSAPKTS